MQGTYGWLKALGLFPSETSAEKSVVAGDFCCREFSQQRCLECAPVRLVFKTLPNHHARAVQGAGKCGVKINMVPDWSLLAS